MAISYTPEQQQVIELHNCNILVSAAAGSGKTAVLVERIVQMVCDETHPVDIDRLLVVTFTNAAAAEMRERIGKAIGERLVQNPTSVHLQRQATLLHNALITTIDSFSLFLIRNHFNEIGLDPGFRVADEGEIKLLQQEVLSYLLEAAYSAENQDFYAMVETFCPGGREAALEKSILDLAKYAMSFPWPEEWLEERKKDYRLDSPEMLLAGKSGRYLKDYVKKVIEGCIERLDLCIRVIRMPDGPYMYGDLLDREKDMLISLLAKPVDNTFGERLEQVTFERLPSKKDDSVDPKKREYVRVLRTATKESLKKLQEQFFQTPLDLAYRQASYCRQPVEMLLDLTIAFLRIMQERKQEKKLIDFSDMEHYALNILLKRRDDGVFPSDVAKEYRQYFHEILIDEYQDSNLVQEFLLQTLSGEDEGRYNRFMVGDVKQSIYKFRLARPELFLEKYTDYKEDGDFRRIDLSRNFRSRKEVVDCANEIFRFVMSRECGGIAYDKKAMLYAGAQYPDIPGCKSELLLVEKPEKDQEYSAREAEAMAVALRIKELLASMQVVDKATGLLRPVRFGDMVILLRTTSGWDEAFKEILTGQGIPVYVTTKTGYFDAPEVQELLNVLRVLDNPLNEIPLFGVMKSLFGGFTEEEIALLKSSAGKESLYQALKLSDTPKAGEFLEKLTAYRKLAVYLPVRELLQRIVADHDYLNYVTALPGGSKRRANVEMLFQKAVDFAQTSYFGLFHFIRYIEQLEKYDVDYGEADTLDENADVVRIMSIHKSKGLEFPVTFVSGLSKRFNMQDVSQNLVLDMDLGLGIDYVNPSTRIRNKTLQKVILSTKMKEDNLSEEVRVLYVALTRAKEKLIMTASLAKPEEKLEALCNAGALKRERLSYLEFMEASSYLDFVLAAVGSGTENTEVAIVKQDKMDAALVKEQVQMAVREKFLTESAQYTCKEDIQCLKERFQRKYPHEALSGLYTKTTVSELKIAAMSGKDEAAYHAFEEKEVIPCIPAFRKEEEKVSGTLRGNAYHRAMELLDFEAVLSGQFEGFPAEETIYLSGLDDAGLTEELHRFLGEKVKDNTLSEEYFAVLDMKKLVLFLHSSLGYRMWRAQREGKLFREQPFVLGIEASRLKEKFPSEEKVLIQGIIDVYFEEDNQLVLLDYKTDVVADMASLWNRYEVQLYYYEEALQRLVGKRVKEKKLYSFHLGMEG